MNNNVRIHNLTTQNLYVLNKKTIVHIISFYLAMFLGSAIIFNIMYRLDYVPSGSMENTLRVSDYIFTNKISYILKNEPQRGDIINFIAPDSREQYVKRVIGLPHETIWIRDGIIYVNDIPLNENYTIPFIAEDCGPFIVPENEYFVLGDNRKNSYDSRYWNYKYVKKEDILGKVIISFNTKDFRHTLYSLF